VYLLEIRSKTGRLLSNTRFYDYNKNSIFIYEDCLLNLGLVYSEINRLIGVYIIKESDPFNTVFDIDDYGRVIHATE
jgi:hypothetical protein